MWQNLIENIVLSNEPGFSLKAQFLQLNSLKNAHYNKKYTICEKIYFQASW